MHAQDVLRKRKKTQKKSHENAQTFQLEQLIDQLFTIREKSFACENYLIRTVYTPVTNAICAWNRRCSVRCPYGALSTRTETVSSSYGLRTGSVRLFTRNFSQAPQGVLRYVTTAEAYLRAKFHLDPSNRLSAVHQRHRQTGQTGQDRQATV